MSTKSIFSKGREVQKVPTEEIRRKLIEEIKKRGLMKAMMKKTAFWVGFEKAASIGASAGRYAMNLAREGAKKVSPNIQRAAQAATQAAKATPPRPAATFGNVAKRARNYVDL